MSRFTFLFFLSCSILASVSAVPDPSALSKSERVAAMARQLGSFGITGVKTSVSNGSVPVRKEIRQLQQDEDQWNLYLLGLQRFQAVDQSQLLSYYQIAGWFLCILSTSDGLAFSPSNLLTRCLFFFHLGIHGRPFVSWDNVGSAPNMGSNGYCTHTSILFPTWHRPYLALYEVSV